MGDTGEADKRNKETSEADVGNAETPDEDILNADRQKCRLVKCEDAESTNVDI